MSVDQRRVVAAVRQLLEAVGEDPDRPGLQETPGRVARFWHEFMDYEPGRLDTVFDSVRTDQLVAVTGIRVWSLCEHHLLPFWCDVSVGYMARDHVLGLSKFARIAHQHAHGLQVQERLVDGIARDVAQLAQTDSVAVVARGVHLCMVMRGIRTEAVMTSSALHGLFRDNPAARQEFMGLVAMDGGAP